MSTTRTALALYSVLLVLPTLVFIWLYWRELEKGFETELAAVPEDATDGARRISSAMSDSLEILLDTERQRPFTDYGEYIHPRDAVGDEILPQLSPMTHRRLPRGILAWFSYSPNRDVEVLVGEDTYGRGGVAEALLPVVQECRQRLPSGLGALSESSELTTYPLAAVAVHMGQRNLDCVTNCAPLMVDRTLTARVSDFRLYFFVDEEGQARAVATRHIATAGLFEELPDEASCLRPLVKGFDLTQGFLLDIQWLFRDLPFKVARQVLAEHEELRVPPRAGPIDQLDTVFTSFDPVEELGFNVLSEDGEQYGRLEVAIDTDDLQARFSAQSRRLLAVSIMFVLTLVTGMTLLYRNIQRELEHAHRMQNFVAAVTHELRTPISTIRLHGEMLLDGWVPDPDKQFEYHQRIVRETDRLSTLVENVLEKSRMTEQANEPVVDDLNLHVERAMAEVAPEPLDTPAQRGLAANQREFELRLAPNLPQVWLTADGVQGILSNLTENARKYAAVEPGGEPILVQTLWDGKQVLLEVADRGPGVPDDERERIFEAFYRVGSEATRTTTGTGLGLHLVRLHAEAAGARVSVHDRQGGGSIFRIAWRASV